MRGLVVVATILAGSPLAAAESCATLDPKAVAAMFDDWNFALSSLDASHVVQRYWPNAVLLPTVSNTPRTNSAMINDYFEHFLAKRPRGRIDTRTIQGGCNVAMDVGTYTFSLMDDKGVTSEVAARYTFIYQYRDGGWKILHHHSSAMPETGASAATPETHAAAAKPAADKPTQEKPPVAAKPVQAAHSAPAHAPAPASVPAPAPALPPAPAVAPAKPKVASKEAPKATAPAAMPATQPAAAPPAETRTALFANLISSPAPSKFYPPEAAKHKERGKVNLSVCADAKGAVTGTPEVVKSSGSKLLDEAAQTWAKAAKWVPATMNHQPVEGCAPIDVVFEAAA